MAPGRHVSGIPLQSSVRGLRSAVGVVAEAWAAPEVGRMNGRRLPARAGWSERLISVPGHHHHEGTLMNATAVRRIARPRLETLEPRCAPAVFTVTNLSDSGDG